jgi:hypothetical protein
VFSTLKIYDQAELSLSTRALSRSSSVFAAKRATAEAIAAGVKISIPRRDERLASKAGGLREIPSEPMAVSSLARL